MELAENKLITLVNSERSDEMCMQSHLTFQSLETQCQLWIAIIRIYKHAVLQCDSFKPASVALGQVVSHKVFFSLMLIYRT